MRPHVHLHSDWEAAVLAGIFNASDVVAGPLGALFPVRMRRAIGSRREKTTEQIERRASVIRADKVRSAARDIEVSLGRVGAVDGKAAAGGGDAIEPRLVTQHASKGVIQRSVLHEEHHEVLDLTLWEVLLLRPLLDRCGRGSRSRLLQTDLRLCAGQGRQIPLNLFEFIGG